MNNLDDRDGKAIHMPIQALRTTICSYSKDGF